MNSIETHDPLVPVTRSLVVAACELLRKAGAGENIVTLNLALTAELPGLLTDIPCPECEGTGERDSGGIEPGSGAYITLACDCLIHCDPEDNLLASQVDSLMEGIGATEDIRDIQKALSSLGLPAPTIRNMIVAMDDKSRIDFLERQVKRFGANRPMWFSHTPCKTRDALPRGLSDIQEAGFRAVLPGAQTRKRFSTLRGCIDADKGLETLHDGKWIFDKDEKTGAYIPHNAQPAATKD